MQEYMTALETLYVRFEAIAEGRVPGGDSSAAHQAVLARLAGNELVAQREGWTAFVLRRLGGTGRVYLEGARPNGGDRSVVPDWLGAPAPDRYEQTGRGRLPGSKTQRGLTATSLAALVATALIAGTATSQLPTGWQSSGTGPHAYTVGYDISRQSGGRQASGLEERSAYIAANVGEPVGAATLTQAIRSDQYRGQRVRLSGFIKQSQAAGFASATLFLRIDASGSVFGTDRRSAMSNAGLPSAPEWIRHEIVVDIPLKSTGLRFGFLKEGAGESWLRNVKLEIVGRDVALTGVPMLVDPEADQPAEIANRIARRESAYRNKPKQPINLDFMNTERLR